MVKTKLLLSLIKLTLFTKFLFSKLYILSTVKIPKREHVWFAMQESRKARTRPNHQQLQVLSWY